MFVRALTTFSWQAIKAGKPAAEAAADAEDAMELEAQAEAEAAEARRAVRAESGKRQAVAGTPAEAAALEPLLMAEGVALRVAAAEALLRLRPVARPVGRPCGCSHLSDFDLRSDLTA